MKFIKRTFLGIIIILSIGILFRGWIYRHSIIYKTISQRSTYTANNKKLTAYFEKDINKLENPDIKDIIEFGLSKTSKHLKFTMSKNSRNPNELINSKSANCIGYASFFTTNCNYLINKFNLSNKWTAKHKVGNIYLFGINIHKYINNPFFKNHDFVIIENKSTGEIYAVDPSVHDYLLIDYVKYSE